MNIGEQNGKLIAAPPCDGICPTGAVPEPLGHLDLQFIAGFMTQRIVNLLEVIHIEVQQRQPPLVPAG